MNWDRILLSKILISGIATKEFQNFVKVEAMIRGQLISKCPFDVFICTKKTVILVKNFCPSLHKKANIKNNGTLSQW